MIPLVIQGANGQEKKIPVILYTAFSETLILPPAEVAALGLPQTGTRTVTFPDGSQVEATVHPTKVLLAGEEHDVDLLAGGWEPRMGIKVLWGYRMSMRFTPGDPVVVERLKTPAE